MKVQKFDLQHAFFKTSILSTGLSVSAVFIRLLRQKQKEEPQLSDGLL